ncbi:glycosyltransferase, partial [Clostridium perfringens]
MIKISIIVPVYNAENYIDNLIKSIINQTFKDYELIIINDGSTDSTTEKLKKYEKIHKNIIIENINNKGPANARNLGVKLAKGNFICFVDSDDYISFNMLDDLYKAYLKSNADIIIGKINFGRNKTYNFKKLDGEITEILDNKILIKMMLSENSTKGYSFLHGKLYKKSLLKDINFEDLMYSEDFIFNMKVYLKARKIIFLNKEIYYYFENTNSLTKSYDSERDYNLVKLFDNIEQLTINIDEIKSEKSIYFLNSLKNFIVNEYNSGNGLKYIIKKIKK